MIVAYKNGAPVRLSRRGDVVDGAENTKLGAWMNTTPAIILNVQRQPGANVIRWSTASRRCCRKLQASLPAAVDVTVLTDRTTPSAPRSPTWSSSWRWRWRWWCW
jgi:multidrug efflux pump